MMMMTPSATYVFKSQVLRRFLNHELDSTYEGWNFNSGNYLFTTDTK